MSSPTLVCNSCSKSSTLTSLSAIVSFDLVLFKLHVVPLDDH